MDVVLAGGHCQRASLSYLKSGDADWWGVVVWF